ncbi:MAG: alpha/beta hydrolase [Pseudomonadota bacterium]
MQIKAQTWILLRGLMREQRHWGDFPALFSEALNNSDAINPVHVVTLDLPGNGQLFDSTSPTQVEAMAQFCRQHVTAMGLAPPYHLLALSLGAMVAVAWADQHPQEIAAAVLINTSLRPFSPFHHRLRPRNYFRLCEMATLASTARREALILQMTSGNAARHAEILPLWQQYQAQYPVSRRNALRQLWAASRYRAPLAKPTIPLLLLAGSQDQLVNPACSEQLAVQWQTCLITHPAAGHDLPLDDGPWLATQVKHWLSTLDEAHTTMT